MKKTLILVLFVNLGVSLSSCKDDCFLLALFSGFYAPDSPEVFFFANNCYELGTLFGTLDPAFFGNLNGVATGSSGLRAGDGAATPPRGPNS